MSRLTPPRPVSTRPDAATRLERQADALDHLIAEMRIGVRDQRHFDALEERASDIAKAVRASFRSPS